MKEVLQLDTGLTGSVLEEPSLPDNEQRARRLVDLGSAYVLKNKLTEARDFFERSLEIYPTADAYTYLGWVMTYHGCYIEAIELCTKAIELDPEFGNPYNDIGVYLMRLKKSKAAIEWFEKAKKAKRYEPRHFPYLNLGILYLKMGRLSRAYEEFSQVLVHEPDHEEAKKQIQELEVLLNFQESLSKEASKN